MEATNQAVGLLDCLLTQSRLAEINDLRCAIGCVHLSFQNWRPKERTVGFLGGRESELLNGFLNDDEELSALLRIVPLEVYLAYQALN